MHFEISLPACQPGRFYVTKRAQKIKSSLSTIFDVLPIDSLSARPYTTISAVNVTPSGTGLSSIRDMSGPQLPSFPAKPNTSQEPNHEAKGTIGSPQEAAYMFERG